MLYFSIMAYCGLLEVSQKAADERNAGPSDALTQLGLVFKEVRKVKMTLSKIGPFKDGKESADLESVLEAKKPELQTIPAHAAENTTSRTEINCLGCSVETLGHNKRKVVMLPSDECVLLAVEEKVQTDAETLKKRKNKLENIVGAEKALDARSLLVLRHCSRN